MKKKTVRRMSQLQFDRAPIARETLAGVRGGIVPCVMPPITDIRTIVPCVMPGTDGAEIRIIVETLLGK